MADTITIVGAGAGQTATVVCEFNAQTNTFTFTITNTSAITQPGSTATITAIGFDLPPTGNASASGLNGFAGAQAPSVSSSFTFSDAALGKVPGTRSVLDFGFITGTKGSFSSGKVGEGLAADESGSFTVSPDGSVVAFGSLSRLVDGFPDVISATWQTRDGRNWTEAEFRVGEARLFEIVSGGRGYLARGRITARLPSCISPGNTSSRPGIVELPPMAQTRRAKRGWRPLLIVGGTTSLAGAAVLVRHWHVARRDGSR